MNVYSALASLGGSETGGLRSAAFLTAVDKKVRLFSPCFPNLSTWLTV